MDSAAIVASFNEAALDGSRWRAALEVLARETGSSGTGLLPIEGQRLTFERSESLAELAQSYVRDGWIHRDARYSGLGALKRNRVITDFDCISTEGMARHPYWQDWLAPHGLRWFAGVKVAFGDDLWILTIQRSINAGPMPQAIVRRLARLSAHLSAAGAVAAALGIARLDGVSQAFDMANRPVIFLNRWGLAVRVNKAAERCLGDDLQITEGRIVSFHPRVTAQLGKAIEDVTWSSEIENTPAIVALPRRTRKPLVAYLTRPPKAIFDVIGQCRCIVTLVDPDQPAEVPDPRALIQAFGLTEAEAAMAQQLARGLSVTEAAAALHVTYETARSHVKTVHDKLGVGHNSEIAAMLTAIAERSQVPRTRGGREGLGGHGGDRRFVQ